MLTLDQQVVIATNEAIAARDYEVFAINTCDNDLIDKAISLTEKAESKLLALEELYGELLC